MSMSMSMSMSSCVFAIVIAVLAIAAPDTVSAFPPFTECYPVSAACDEYTSDFPIGSEAQKTTWEGLIGINRFDPNGRTLEKVTVNTKIFFTSKVFVTCTGDSCSTSPGGASYTYKGIMYPGMQFKMQIDNTADAQRLQNFWGRWGDFPDATEVATDDSKGGAKLFVPYTYPLFDIDGDEAILQDPDLLPIIGGVRWAYYTPTETGATQFWYGSLSSGTLVSGGAGPFSTSELNELSDPPAVRAAYPFGKGSAFDTPKDVEVELGSITYDRYSTPFSKSITIQTDPMGGLNNDITPQQAANPFIGTGQMFWRVNATGVFEATDEGGNAGKRQESSARVAMQVIYEWSGAAFTGDPQFAGFQGQSFQVHGYPGSYFHLVSAPSFQMNGRFAYIASGHCTYKHTTCWTHPGTYIDDLTFVVQELLIRVTAGPVGQGYSVRINDEPFHGHQHINATDSAHTDRDGIHGTFTPTKFYDAATRLTVHLKSPLELMIRTELFSFTITNADHFFNVASQLMVRPILAAGRQPSSRYPHPVTGSAWYPSYPIHGFIGQTWCSARYTNNKQYQGDVDDYVETRPYATDSIYSQYNQKFAADMQFD